MKIDNYFYINSNLNFHLDNNIIENFSLDFLNGPPGNKGVIGNTGSRGLQGLQGARGPNGIRGSQGDTGPQGYRGIAGKIGRKGKKGSDGSKGKDGLTGYVGEKGDFGEQGEEGPKGIIGPDGLKGPNGFVGAQGQEGDNGENGSSITNTNEDIDPQEHRLYSWGNYFTMDGFTENNTEITGQTINPFNQFTIGYNYVINGNKNILCPPNSYLNAFSYERNGPMADGTQPDSEWCSNNGRTCSIGYDQDNKLKKKSLWNKSRPGMPYKYKTECAMLYQGSTMTAVSTDREVTESISSINSTTERDIKERDSIVDAIKDQIAEDASTIPTG